MNTARRFFVAGSIIVMLSGIGHLLSMLLAPEPPVHAVAIAAMKAARAEVMGMAFTLWGGFQCIGASFALLAIFLGLQNLLTVSALSAQRGALGRAATTSGACSAALLALGAYFHIPPPIIFYVPAVLCFAVAAARAD